MFLVGIKGVEGKKAELRGGGVKYSIIKAKELGPKEESYRLCRHDTSIILYYIVKIKRGKGRERIRSEGPGG